MMFFVAIGCFITLAIWGGISDYQQMRKPKGDTTAFWEHVRKTSEH